MSAVDLEPFFLASKSPRRFELLEKLGLRFTVIDCLYEEVLDPTVSAEELPRHLAVAKGCAASDKILQGTIISGDTLVIQGAAILGKPKSRSHAFDMLKSLSGLTHRVVSGLALHHRPSDECVSRKVATDVTMRVFSDREITEYIETLEPMDKAGAYAIQGGAAAFVERIEGSYDNVVGLPTEIFFELVEELRRKIS